MPVSKKHPYVGIAAIVVRNNQVLIGKRKNAHDNGVWSFPGGHLEFGESWESCIKREVEEETGLKVKQINPAVPTNDIFVEEKLHYVKLFFEVECESGEPRLAEPEKCAEWRWFKWDNLPKDLMLPIKNLLATGYRPTDLAEKV